VPSVCGNDLRVIVPPELREKVLQKVHGREARGYWGILRTEAMVRAKYNWKVWAADVESAVAKCMAVQLIDVQSYVRRAWRKDVLWASVPL
jgi:Integrase zinc binding domain